MGYDVRSFKDLVAWQKSMALVAEVYRASQGFPKEEIFGLTSQIRRSAVSVPSNIAEGNARTSKKEFQYFLSNARGSLAELETQLLKPTNSHILTKRRKIRCLTACGR